MTFTYLDSYGDLITETKPILSVDQICEHIMDRHQQFIDAGPGSRESEASRAIRKWISAHPIRLLKRAWSKLDEEGKMEMSMMLSKDSHHGISDPKWAKENRKSRYEIVGDNLLPL